MTCPRCGASAMERRERDGVEIDVCMCCRGVWLDRGEFDRLLAKARGAHTPVGRWRPEDEGASDGALGRDRPDPHGHTHGLEVPS